MEFQYNEAHMKCSANCFQAADILEALREALPDREKYTILHDFQNGADTLLLQILYTRLWDTTITTVVSAYSTGDIYRLLRNLLKKLRIPSKAIN